MQGQSRLASDVNTDDACQLIDHVGFELFLPVASMEEMTIKCSKAGCGWNGLGMMGRLLFSVVNIDNFCWGAGGVRKEVAIYGWVIKYNCSTWLPTSLTPQSNGNDVGDGNGNKVASNKRAMGRMARAMATAKRVAGKQ